MSTPKTIRTLIVDDSAFVRKTVRQMLSTCPQIEVVGAARDGEEALDLVEQLRPDVVTCDLMMPRLDGVGFVRRQMQRRRVPILVLTAAPQDGESAVEALNAGAVDLVQKPTALATDDLFAISAHLVAKVKTAALASLGSLGGPEAAPADTGGVAPSPGPAPRGPQLTSARADLVVIGISTGGPQALRYMLPLFPADFPVPIAIVLHMPVGYTALYAEKLDELCALEVREARDGDLLRPGLALIAQAGKHLQFRRTPHGVAAQLSLHPFDKTHRPAADVLFRSAAEIFGERVLAVVMTGMGDDGLEGAGWVKAQGGTVLTEAEQSCVIYGMPRSVAEAGLSDGAIPLPEMARAIFQRT